MLKILIFDWDGVIVDSIPYKYGGIWENVFPEDAKERESVVNFLKTDEGKLVNRYGLVRHALVETGEDTLKDIPDSDLKNHPLIQKYIERYNKAAVEGVVQIGMYPEVKKVLQELKTKGYRMYVISGGGTDRDLEKMADELGVRDYFLKLFGFGNPKMPLVTFGKYKNFERLVAVEGTKNPEQYTVIGDGQSDKILAQEIGCSFIGIAREWNGWKANDNKRIVSKTKDILRFL